MHETSNTTQDNQTASLQPYSIVLIRLLQGVLYQESAKEWNLLLSYQAPIRNYFAVLNINLFLDEQEGYAFLTQRATDATNEYRESNSEETLKDDKDSIIPRLIRRAPLSYDATLLCVLLRERLLQFDTQEKESARLIISNDEIIELIRPYLTERNDELKLINKIDSCIKKVIELGFLKELKSGTSLEYEVRRIIKSRINAEQLLEIKEKLIIPNKVT